MALEPKYTVAELRGFRAGALREAAQKALAIDRMDLEEFAAQENGDVGIALVQLAGAIVWQSRVALDDYLFAQDDIADLLPPDFQVARMAFAERLIQCRDWLHFRSPDIGPDMANVGGCIVDLIAIGQAANAAELCEVSRQVLEETGYSWQVFWRNRRGTKPEIPDEEFPTQKLLPFAHELIAAQAGEEIDWEALFLETEPGYIAAARSVMSTDMAKVKAAVDALCDLHITFTTPNPDGNLRALEGYEIDTWHHMLWPTTVFAYLRVRQAHGLELPALDHPLLRQTMGQFPPRPFKTQDLPEWYLSALEALGNADPNLSDLRSLVMRENTL
ncbi:hypothetical protein [Celeribacter ethanolicus]|uniref:hypothetical protein n=1 Tax=Celeribacter ethanolicus TaxID=1758178 RepID=UPI00082E360E|nr:hypothetical protein [Celeribacter ethanolicus]